jgi:hypothetical protein
MKEWQQKYKEVSSSHPKRGDVLYGEGGKKAKLIVELHNGCKPFLFTRAYVSMVVGEEPKWVLAPDKRKTGVVVIVMTNSATKLIAKHGIDAITIDIDSLRIVKPAKNGKSLLAETI